MATSEKRPTNIKLGEFWCLVFDEDTGEELGGVLVTCCHTREDAAISAAHYHAKDPSDSEHDQLRVIVEDRKRFEMIVTRHCEWRADDA